MDTPQFVALVPVKPPSVGKSRMQGISDADRARLAAGFARDVVAACLATPSVAQVLVVTDDARFAGELADAGCAVLPDGVTGDLNESLRLAAREAHRRWSGLVPVAVCADLPALRPEDLLAALSGWDSGAAFVADADGVGTTLYVAPTEEFAPTYGEHSREAHLAAGARELSGAGATLRRDVDDVGALHDAARLGLGAHTAAVVASLSSAG